MSKPYQIAVAFALLVMLAVLGYAFFWPVAETGQGGQQDATQQQTQKPKSKPRTDIVERVEQATTAEQLDAMSALLDKTGRQGGELDEISRLLAYIKQDRPEGIDQDAWQLLMNASFNAIRRVIDPTEPNQVAETLAHLALHSDDHVIRLYALQHISFWYEKETSDRELLASVLRDSVERVDDTAGTAAMVMSDLQRGGHLEGQTDLTQIDSQLINQAASQVITNPEARTSVRVTAVHVLSDRKQKASLPQLRQLALDTQQPIILRKAVIFAIGQLGTRQDIDLLKQVEPNARLQAAVRPAINKLRGS